MAPASSSPTPVAGTGSAAEQNARALLHDHGFRATHPRVALLVELLNEPAPGHVSIADLHRRIRVDGGPVDYSTVFRAVLALTAAGVLHPLAVPERSTTYGLAGDPHHHAVCTGCGSVSEVPAERLRGAFDRVRRAAVMAVAPSGSLTVHGLCATCAGGDAGSSPRPGSA